MSWKQRKKLSEDRGDVLHEMQSMLDTANEEKRDLIEEESGKFDELNTRAEDLGRQIERYDKVIELTAAPGTPGSPAPGNSPGNPEARSQQPGREDFDPQQEQCDEAAELEQRAFTQYLRDGLGSAEEQRALTTAGQGVVGIRPFSTQLFDKMTAFAGVREAGAEIVPTTHGNEFTFGDGDDTANEGRLVGEAATNANETNPNLGNVKLSAFKFSSDWIKVSHEMLQDAAYDVESYILRKASERIGRAFNRYSTTGTGTGQSQGILVGGSQGKVAAALDALTYEEVLDLIHSVDAAYRNQPGFRLMFNDTTLSAIRKLKDGSGAYLWAAGAAGAPNQVLGYAYTVNNHMPTLGDGADSKVIVAGDFGRVIVRDVTTPVIIRAVEKFADDGLVGFKVDSRHDSRVADSTAIKWLETAAA